MSIYGYIEKQKEGLLYIYIYIYIYRSLRSLESQFEIPRILRLRAKRIFYFQSCLSGLASIIYLPCPIIFFRRGHCLIISRWSKLYFRV